MSETRALWCCACAAEVAARLTDGHEVYPHRGDLAGLPFWRCDGCGNWVGCHYKTADRTRPLGNIPSPEIKAARQYIHRLLDPLWMDGGRRKRTAIYAQIATALGRQEYHTGEIRSLDEARQVYRVVQQIGREQSANLSQKPSHAESDPANPRGRGG